MIDNEDLEMSDEDIMRAAAEAEAEDAWIGLCAELQVVIDESPDRAGAVVHVAREVPSLAGAEGLDPWAGQQEERDTMTELPEQLRGWWRIVETSQWVDDGLDIIGPALISLTGHGDRLRMHCLLAYLNARPTKTGVSFSWEGAGVRPDVRQRERPGRQGRAVEGNHQDQGRGQQHVHGGAGRRAGRADPRAAVVPGQVAASMVIRLWAECPRCTTTGSPA